MYAGYTSRRPLPSGHWERVSLYRIGLYLDYLEAAAQDKSEIAQIMAQLLHEMDWLEKRV